jgi:hypothetical protein
MTFLTSVHGQWCLWDQLRKFARSEMQHLARDRRYLYPDEFFKLAIESGLDVYLAASVRDAARSVK